MGQNSPLSFVGGGGGGVIQRVPLWGWDCISPNTMDKVIPQYHEPINCTVLGGSVLSERKQFQFLSVCDSSFTNNAIHTYKDRNKK